MYNFFSVHQDCKTKKFAIKKISNTKFCKIHIIPQTSNTKEIRENIVKKIFAGLFLWKEKFSSEKIR